MNITGSLHPFSTFIKKKGDKRRYLRNFSKIESNTIIRGKNLTKTKNAPKQRTKINGKRLTKKAEEIRQRKKGRADIKEVILPRDSMIIILNDNRNKVISCHKPKECKFILNPDGKTCIIYCKYFEVTYIRNQVYVLVNFAGSMPKLVRCINNTPYRLEPTAWVAREFCRENRWPVNFRGIGYNINVKIDNNYPNDKFTLVCLWEIPYYGRGDTFYYYRVIIQDKSSGAMYVDDPSKQY